MISDTFRKIEEEKKIIVKNNESTPLEEWYEAVRDKKFDNFSIEDLCRAIRQDMYIEYLFPYVIKRLKKDILSGSMYDGELLAALNSIDLDFLGKFDKGRKEFLDIINREYHNMNPDIKNELDKLLIKIQK